MSEPVWKRCSYEPCELQQECYSNAIGAPEHCQAEPGSTLTFVAHGLHDFVPLEGFDTCDGKIRDIPEPGSYITCGCVEIASVHTTRKQRQGAKE